MYLFDFYHLAVWNVYFKGSLIFFILTKESPTFYVTISKIHCCKINSVWKGKFSSY